MSRQQCEIAPREIRQDAPKNSFLEMWSRFCRPCQSVVEDADLVFLPSVGRFFFVDFVDFIFGFFHPLLEAFHAFAKATH